MKTVSCDEGHGRLPWLGHVACRGCGKLHKHQPIACTACRGMTFEVACAKCFASEARGTAPTSFEIMGEAGSPGYE